MTVKKTQLEASNGSSKRKVTQAGDKKAAPKPRPRKSSAGQPSAHTEMRWTEEEIASQAYFLWESRGRPFGSPEEDWHKAKEQLHGDAQ